VKLRDSLISGESTPADVASTELLNIESYNEKLNAFITVFERNSRPIQTQLKKLGPFQAKKKGDGRSKFPLFGIPFVIKDNIFFSGYRTTAGSGVFQDFVPQTNSDVVDAFLTAGGVPLGKTNLHELAMGATSSSSFFGPVRNPADSSRISGGSSGGSAVAVAMSTVPLIGIGTDTGGSVRIPAALCGVCGLKPTLGTLSTIGVFPLSATLDHIGILTKTMDSMSDAFRAITHQPPPNDKSRKSTSSPKIEIGIPTEDYFFEDCDKSVSRAFWKTIEKMTETGQFEIVRNIDIPDHSRFSRIRKSIQVKEAGWFYEELVTDPEKRKLVRPDVLGFLDKGRMTGMLEYMMSSVERLHMISKMAGVFKAVDFLAMPTCLAVAPRLEEILGKEAGSIRLKLVRNTEPFNLCGFPSLSLPTHDLGSSFLPTAIEISGNAGSDIPLIEVGQQIWNCLH
jgi:aspartyl-tRNA(Asn)/glutamyl-tRNA(Gln) amidotransferase subunit A